MVIEKSAYVEVLNNKLVYDQTFKMVESHNKYAKFFTNSNTGTSTNSNTDTSTNSNTDIKANSNTDTSTNSNVNTKANSNTNSWTYYVFEYDSSLLSV